MSGNDITEPGRVRKMWDKTQNRAGQAEPDNADPEQRITLFYPLFNTVVVFTFTFVISPLL